jgi:hypothetical protein
MQEHFSAGAYMPCIPKDEAASEIASRYAGNAGAISGECEYARYPEKRSLLLLN